HPRRPRLEDLGAALGAVPRPHPALRSAMTLATASWLPRSGHLVLRVGAQVVPAAGVFGLSWPAAGGLMLYWIESVLALGATALLLMLFARRARAPERAADRQAIEHGLRSRD